MFKNKQPPEIITIQYNGNTYDCVVKRTTRKNISISVSQDCNITIHSTHYALKKTLHKIANDNIIWIMNKIDLQQIRNLNSRNDLGNKGVVKYLGDDYNIIQKNEQNMDVVIKDNTFYVLGNNELDMNLSIKSFYRKQAKKIFYERMQYWIPQVDGASAKTKLVIKQMKTRWGSMSSAGNMNLNIALIKTPRDCIDYVIVHELCHQKHPHHQKQFWDAVKFVIPEYKKQEKILKLYTTKN